VGRPTARREIDHGIKALSPGAKLNDTKSPSEKELRFPPNTQVRLSYVLIKDWDGPLNSGTRFRADLSPDYFHIVGTTSLVYPDVGDPQVMDVQFDWRKLPPAWSLATSFGTDNRCQSFHGRWHEAVNSLFVGGDYRIYHTVISGNALNFAVRGKWSFTDDEWVSQVRKIMEFERTFWHDNDFPYFLVTLTPFGQDHGSNGGTALTNSYMVHLSRLDPLTGDTIGDIAHETFHAWNPGKMGHTPGSDYPISWFFEGFTTYYQDVMLFRAGLMSFPEYVAAINKTLRKYALNEGTEISLQEFIQRHSADHSVLNQLDHRRGAVLAAWLDATIRHETENRSSLDNLMFDLVAQNTAYERRHHGQPMKLDNKRVFRATSRYIHRASRKQFRQYVEQGGSIRVPETALGPCVQSYVEESWKFDLGFDPWSIRSKDKDKKVSGVEPGSEAFKAGVRDGQKLKAWSLNFGDPSQLVRLTIESEDGKRVLTYYPRGARTSVQQFRLNSTQYFSNPETCTVGR
jgi:predicted metalloprotease with PDZ domain